METYQKRSHPWSILAFIVLLLAVGIYLITGNFSGNPVSIERQSYQCNQAAKTCFVELVAINHSQSSLKGQVTLKVYSTKQQKVRLISEILFPSVFKSDHNILTYSLKDVENVSNIEISLQSF